MIETVDMLRWIGSRVRTAGTGRMVRRAAEVWTAGGVRLLRAHMHNAAASAARERRYQRWIGDVEAGLFEREIGDAPLRAGPLISVVVPIFNTAEAMLARCVESVVAQSYERWELILVDDASTVGRVARQASALADRDERIRFIKRGVNGGIAAATNDGLAIATGEYIALLDHDDELSPHALRCVARRLSENPALDFVYSDEDKIDERGRRHSPAFKPSFSPQYLWTCNYICHLSVCRASLLRNLGGLHGDYEGAQDYDLVLRVTEETDRIEHIPLVLYHWRSHADSTAGAGQAKPYAVEAGRRAVEAAARRRAIDGKVDHGRQLLTYRIQPNLCRDDRVHVLLRRRATHGAETDGSRSDQSLAARLGQLERVHQVETFDVGDERRDETLLADRVLALISGKSFPTADRDEESETTGAPPKWILIIDSDLEPVECDDWLDRLLKAGGTPLAGPVGPRIVDATGNVEDAGLVFDIQSRSVGWVYRGVRSCDPGYLWSLVSPRNVGALSGACMLIGRPVAADALAAGYERWGRAEVDGELRSALWSLCLSALTASIGLAPHILGDVVLRRRRARPRRVIGAPGDLTWNVIGETPAISGRLIRNLSWIDPAYLCPDHPRGADAGRGSSQPEEGG